MIKPDMSLAVDLAIQHGGAEYMKLLASPGHGLPLTYPPGTEMALANDAGELGTDWVPTPGVFNGTLDGKAFHATKVLIRIDGVVRFWHKIALTHPGLGCTATITFPHKLWVTSDDYVYPYPHPTSNMSSGYGSSGEMLRRAVPGLDEYATCPHCGGESTWRLDALIIHLNDTHRWTRERIADWLDTIDIDLTFPVPETIPSNIH